MLINKRSLRTIVSVLTMAAMLGGAVMTVSAEPSGFSYATEPGTDGNDATKIYYDKDTGVFSVLSSSTYIAGTTSHRFYMYEIDQSGKAGLMHTYQYIRGNSYNESICRIDDVDVDRNEIGQLYDDFAEGKTVIDMNSQADFYSTSSFINNFNQSGSNMKTAFAYEGKLTHLESGLDLNRSDKRSGLFEIEWESTDPSVAEVTASGAVTAKTPGSCIIRAKLKETGSLITEYFFTVMGNN